MLAQVSPKGPHSQLCVYENSFQSQLQHNGDVWLSKSFVEKCRIKQYQYASSHLFTLVHYIVHSGAFVCSNINISHKKTVTTVFSFDGDGVPEMFLFIIDLQSCY